MFRCLDYSGAIYSSRSMELDRKQGTGQFKELISTLGFSFLKKILL